MEERIVQFIAALRASGVRVSLAESADAFQAADQLGIIDREAFRISLRTTLIKNADDIPHFERLFPMFFQTNQPPPLLNAAQDLSPEDAKMLADALRQFTEQLRKMMEKLLEGKPLSPEELRQLDQLVNMDNVSDPRLQNLKASQMEKALQFREVKEAMEALLKMLQEMGMNKQSLEQIREALEANQQALKDQIHQHAGQRIIENLSQKKRQDRQDGLHNLPFHRMSDGDMADLRREVQRLAAALRTRLALRLKRARNGHLDVKATIRTNLKYGAVPLELKHKDHSQKPKVVIICDISTSMRHCSELMLSLIYAIQDQISKTDSFAFIDHLEYISPDFSGRQAHEAVENVLERMPSGHYNTDLGKSLNTFQAEYMNKIDYRSTLIMVGDARNNYNDPKLEIFRTLARRSRSTIWLNPEAASLWGTGDSDMLKYATQCDRVYQVSTLGQLATAIDQLLLGG